MQFSAEANSFVVAVCEHSGLDNSGGRSTRSWSLRLQMKILQRKSDGGFHTRTKDDQSEGREPRYKVKPYFKLIP